MPNPAVRLEIAVELMEAGMLCKCPSGPTVEIEHPTMAGWYTKKTPIAHTAECEAKQAIRDILEFAEQSPDKTVAGEKQ